MNAAGRDLCVVCGSSIGEPVYTSDQGRSITSLCEVIDSPTEVRFCRSCGHLQTPELPGLAAYYDTQYKILIDSEEEDQLYAVNGEQKTFRLDHQAETLLKKLNPRPGAMLLDYGCAKGGTPRRLLTERGDLLIHLFDVSEMYLPFWKAFLSEDRWSTYNPRPEWRGAFDIVTSFFSLEHVAAPRVMMGEIASLLKPGGTFYGIVPNTFTNIADFVVSDHVNHFSAHSLATLLQSSVFEVVEIDDRSHTSAFVVTATVSKKPRSSVPITRDDIARLEAEVTGMANYWRSVARRVQDFERGRAGRPVALYGSGIYSTFLATCLAAPRAIRCFLDQNPFRQGKTLLQCPIIAPSALTPDINTVYVGLNPALARAEIAKLTCWSGRQMDHFYL